MTPAEAHAAFLWRLVSPWEVYRAIARLPVGQRGGLTSEASRQLGVSERTIQRRVARFWPVATEAQEPGGLHDVICDNHPCTCQEVILI